MSQKHATKRHDQCLRGAKWSLSDLIITRYAHVWN
jgi:hypothetical protein